MDMRIDELAQRAGVPSRTIRYYTQQELLPPPNLRGRVGFYDDAHLERLRLIKELQEKRYLPLNVIRSVLRRFEAGADLETMLAPLDMVFAPRWDSGARRELTRAELAEAASTDEETVEAAEQMGFLFPRRRGRDSRYTDDDVHMLEVAGDWLALGLPRELGHLYRRSLEQISKMQVRAFNECVVSPVADKQLTPEETRRELVDGYNQMSRTFNRLVALLHRKLLQKAVESYVGHEPAPE
jgi:DNA-binding transcriptional MerR regulator